MQPMSNLKRSRRAPGAPQMDDIDGNAQEAELNALNVGKTYKDATTGIVKQKDVTVIHTTLGVDTRIPEIN